MGAYHSFFDNVFCITFLWCKKNPDISQISSDIGNSTYLNLVFRLQTAVFHAQSRPDPTHTNGDLSGYGAGGVGRRKPGFVGGRGLQKPDIGHSKLMCKHKKISAYTSKIYYLKSFHIMIKGYSMLKQKLEKPALSCSHQATIFGGDT